MQAGLGVWLADFRWLERSASKLPFQFLFFSGFLYFGNTRRNMAFALCCITNGLGVVIPVSLNMPFFSLAVLGLCAAPSR